MSETPTPHSKWYEEPDDSEFAYPESPAFHDLLDKAQHRDSEQLLNENAQKMMQNLDTYRRESTNLSEEEWLARREQFAEAFQPLWSHIVHRTDRKLPQNPDASVIIRSAQQVADELGQPVEYTMAASALGDVQMKSTDFVCASVMGYDYDLVYGDNSYTISPDIDGIVAPIDINELHHHSELPTQEDDLRESLKTYVNNLLRVKDFYIFFSAYAALFFEAPQDMLDLFKKIYEETIPSISVELGEGVNFWYSEGDDADVFPPFDEDEILLEEIDRLEREQPEGWEDRLVEMREERERDNAVLYSMRDLYRKFDIFPPVNPEFQYRGEVKGFSED